MVTNAQSVVDDTNKAFWDELCGSHAAKLIGVTDDSPRSLKRFDDWFLSFYPYVFYHIPFEEFRDKDVLEVGLGYGTIGQRIAESGARYQGLDIAPGPVSMMAHRLGQAGLPGCTGQGSLLEPPFPDCEFDFIVTIGCLHHTGNMARAIEQCYRLLRPGGKLIAMVYYAYSYRRFHQARKDTLRYAARELLGYRGVVGASDESKRASYDTNAAGRGAPHTDWISIRSLRHLCREFSSFSAQTENIDNGVPFHKSPPRRELLKTWWPRLIGLDLYATAIK